MIEITCNMIAPCKAEERSIMELYVEQANNIKHFTNWDILFDLKDEVARRFPNQVEVIKAIKFKASVLYHEEEYYAGLL